MEGNMFNRYGLVSHMGVTANTDLIAGWKEK